METVRKTGRPRKVIDNVEEILDKQREYKRLYMKQYLDRKRLDPAFVEHRKVVAKAYRMQLKSDDAYLMRKDDYEA
jgi:hypothetical protein